MHSVSYLSWRHKFGKHGIIENTKTSRSWQRDITFPWNKKILNLKWHILRSYRFVAVATFNEIALAFLPVEGDTNILHVNINFTGNLFFGFGRYCGKVFPDTVSHIFWAPALRKNVVLIFFSRLVNGSRYKRVSAFLLCLIGFEAINFHILFIEMSCFRSNLFFENKITIKNYQKRGDTCVQQCFWKLWAKFESKRASRSCIGDWRTCQPRIFTYFASSLPLKFFWHSFFNLAKSTCSF